MQKTLWIFFMEAFQLRYSDLSENIKGTKINSLAYLKKKKSAMMLGNYKKN